MPNLHDYVLWRGDIPFDQVPLGEVDRLLFAQLAYVFFDDVMPLMQKERVLLQEAAHALLFKDDEDKVRQIALIWKDNKELLELVEHSERYKNLHLKYYQNVLDDTVQFSAVTFELPDVFTLIAYRGTDDSVVGWKEDMALLNDQPVPAQLYALSYAQTVALESKNPLHLVGHSKGGNLAVFAGAQLEKAIQERIVSITNFDGPGINLIQVDENGYNAIKGKIEKFIPQSSFVGFLLETDSRYTVVKSDTIGILQHSAMSWQIMGGKMVRQGEASGMSLYIDFIIKQWLNNMTSEKRIVFIKALYEIVDATQLKSFMDIDFDFIMGFPATFSKIRSIDANLRKEFYGELRGLLHLILKSITGEISADQALLEAKQQSFEQNNAHIVQNQESGAERN